MLVLVVVTLPAAIYLRLFPERINYIIRNNNLKSEAWEEGMCAASAPPFALKSTRVITPLGIKPAVVVVQEGKIAQVLDVDRAHEVGVPLEDVRAGDKQYYDDVHSDLETNALLFLLQTNRNE